MQEKYIDARVLLRIEAWHELPGMILGVPCNPPSNPSVDPLQRFGACLVYTGNDTWDMRLAPRPVCATRMSRIGCYSTTASISIERQHQPGQADRCFKPEP